jgi:hypothetical protein
LHAPHLRNIQDRTCAIRTVEGEDFTTRKPVADLSAPRSGPRYDPQQLLRRSRYASDPPVPVNTIGTSVSRESTSRARRARLALPPPSRSYEMDARSSTSSALWASQRHLPTDATDNSAYLVEEANLHNDAPAAAYQRRSLPSPSTSGALQETGYTTALTFDPSDPKGKRPMTYATNEEETPMPSRDVQTCISGPRQDFFANSLPTRLSPIGPDLNVDRERLRQHDQGSATLDAEAAQSSDATAPSSSLVPSHERRKRRRDDSAVDEPPQQNTVASTRTRRRRRLDGTGQRTGSMRHSLPHRTAGARITTNSLSSYIRRNKERTEEEHALLHSGALELLEGSHRSLRAYLASYFESNRRLRAELADVREEHRDLERRFADAERCARRYWTGLYAR